MKSWRRTIHQHPELGFGEFATSRLVAECLEQWGYEVHRGIAVTGVVGTLRWGAGGPRLGLRADMDALPIQELTGLPWASRTPGQMHACGHDGHTTMLLGAAQVFARMHREGRLPGSGTLHLIFQPAEELGGGGGARRMLDEGLLERFPCDAVFAMHNYPGVPTGHFRFRAGPFMASSDRVMIRFSGKGGHGALPHLAVDPMLPAAATVLALQAIVGRNIDPNDAAVISVGRIEAGNTYNVIPETAEMELSVRALRPEVRDLLEARIRTLVEGQAAAFGVSSEVQYERGYPVLVNSVRETQLAAEVARELVGAARVVEDAPPLSGSEDFAFILQRVPGCYLLIGNGDNGFGAGEHLGPCSVHNPHYDFNDDCLVPGAAFWVALGERFFGE
ncbi:amidohydrolase [Pseudomonas lalucatii]|uniref:Amidohydrolase n=2 Tax=Pseudomonas lalucatii TaxID=1424203 RepID=A0ABS5Q2H3_9PSED|nr:amidohydrolase [Pseudomonas lalucatii]MBS7690087.1 amidohydrolase [Pseudomonas lalucatii]QVM88960.1 amidohydrolase [Pseudomonas lalucatii]